MVLVRRLVVSVVGPVVLGLAACGGSDSGAQSAAGGDAGGCVDLTVGCVCREGQRDGTAFCADVWADSMKSGGPRCVADTKSRQCSCAPYTCQNQLLGGGCECHAAIVPILSQPTPSCSAASAQQTCCVTGWGACVCSEQTCSGKTVPSCDEAQIADVLYTGWPCKSRVAACGDHVSGQCTE